MAKSKRNEQSVSSTLSPNEVGQAIEALVRRVTPGFIWGPPGIGKSDKVKEVAKNLGMDVCDIRLSQLEPSDLRGIPIQGYDESGNPKAVWAVPDFLPQGGRPTLMFMDELNSAVPTVQAAAYQLVLDRQLGSYKLPDDCAIIAAGNRQTDKGTTFKMATPLANRFVHLEMEANHNDWIDWAIRNHVDGDIVGFIEWKKTMLFDFNPKSHSSAFPTPRTWEYVNRVLKEHGNLPNKVLQRMVAGCVGDGAAIEFMNFREETKKLPNPTDILNGKITSMDNNEVHLHYSLITSMCYELLQANKMLDNKELETKDWDSMCDRFLGFSLDNFQPEIGILGTRIALNKFDIEFNPSNLENWSRFTERYGDLILDND